MISWPFCHHVMNLSLHYKYLEHLLNDNFCDVSIDSLTLGDTFRLWVPLIHTAVFEIFKLANRIIHLCFWPSHVILQALVRSRSLIFCNRLSEKYCVHLQHLPENYHLRKLHLQPLPEVTQGMNWISLFDVVKNRFWNCALKSWIRGLGRYGTYLLTKTLSWR